MTKRIASLLCVVILGWLAPRLLAQSVQECLVSEYRGNEAKTALAGVSVTAANAGSVMSSADGRLSLQFRSLKVGDQIQFRRIDLAGYEVMNREAVEVARIARASAADPEAATLHIVMARRSLLQKLRDGYRSVAVQRYEKQLKTAEAEAQRLREAGQLAEDAYNDRMNQLEEEYDAKLSQLETYIDKFARIDLSDLDTDESQIINLVQQGNFDEALELYDRQDLANRLRQNRADQIKLAEASQQIAAAERQKALENQRLRQSIDRQVTLLRMAGGEENLQKVHRILHETFLADTTDWEARRDYAFSLLHFREYEPYIALLQSGIAQESDSLGRCMMMLDLMRGYKIYDKYDEAYLLAKQCDSDYTPMLSRNYSIASRAFPAWTQTLLDYYMQQDRFEECKPLVQRIQNSWAPDTLNEKSLITYMSLLTDISDYGSHVLDHKLALWASQEAIRLGTIIENRWQWLSDMHSCYANTCSTFALEGQRQEMLSSARGCADRLSAILDKAGSVAAYCDAAKCYFLLAETLVGEDEYELADSIMTQAMNFQVFERAEQSGVETISLFHSLFDYYRSIVLLQQGNMEEAETLAKSSLLVLESLEDGVDMVTFLRPAIMAELAFARTQYEEALTFAKEAVAVSKTIYASTEDAWDADQLCKYYMLLAKIQHAAGKKSDASKTLKEAQKIAVFESNRQKVAQMNKRMK